MSNPWERPPLPSAGNATPNDLYIGVGRVLSQWEIVELQLGYLYTAFVLKHQNWEAVIEYGRGPTFKSRSDILTKAAKHFFVAHNNQRIEGDFDCLFRRTVLFGDRRHDVVHAVVRDESWARWIIQLDPPTILLQGDIFFFKHTISVQDTTKICVLHMLIIHTI